MIKLENIEKSFDDKKVIKNFSLHIKDNEFIVLTGKSGSGKTTLLNILGLLENPDQGSIQIDNKESFNRKEKTMFYRNEAGYLFQNFALIENETVINNLKIALEYQKISKQQEKEKINTVLEDIGLSSYANKKIYQLSGGEQQRVALARIMLKKPKYIYADEPTGNLDMENRNIVLQHLQKLKDKGCTVIMVTHDEQIANMPYVTQHIKL